MVRGSLLTIDEDVKLGLTKNWQHGTHDVYGRNETTKDNESKRPLFSPIIAASLLRKQNGRGKGAGVADSALSASVFL